MVRSGKMTLEEADKILEEDRQQFSQVDEELVQRFNDRIRMRK